MGNSNTKPTKFPLIVGLVSISLSIVLAALPYLKVVSNSNLTSSLIGWALTPVLTFTMFGLDFFFQTKGLSQSNFVSIEIYGKILKLVAYLSILVAMFHIWRIALIWSLV
jgi:F0F1-type ATP synthase assembly protein I